MTEIHESWACRATVTSLMCGRRGLKGSSLGPVGGDGGRSMWFAEEMGVPWWGLLLLQVCRRSGRGVPVGA